MSDLHLVISRTYDFQREGNERKKEKQEPIMHRRHLAGYLVNPFNLILKVLRIFYIQNA